MTFLPGNQANPGGRPKDKRFTEALRLALMREVDETDDDGKPTGAKTTKLRQIADKLVAQALDGESWAIQQVADRIDGKPPQAIVGEEDGPLTVIVRKFSDG
jgi:hypothetical protein